LTCHGGFVRIRALFSEEARDRRRRRVVKQSVVSATVRVVLLVSLIASCSRDVSEKGAAPTAGAPDAAAPSEPTADEIADPLLAWAEGEPEEGKAPLRVQFNADIEGGTPPLTIKWTFGDDSPPSSETDPVHTYPKPGSYRADLAVNDSAGDSDSDWVEIEVE
jgi:PKD repeat protein